MSSVPQELLGTWSRRSTNINPPKYAIAYTFSADGSYQFDAILQPSLGVEEQHQQIVGSLTVNGSHLDLMPIAITKGQKTENSFQNESYEWQVDDSLAAGGAGVIVLKLIGTTEERTFYKNA